MQRGADSDPLRLSLVPGAAVETRVFALVAVEDVGYVGLLDLGAGEMHPDATLIAFYHGPPCKGFPAVTGDQVPRVVTCMGRESTGCYCNHLQQRCQQNN